MMVITIACSVFRVNRFPPWQLGNNNIDPPHPRLATLIQRERGERAERGNVIRKTVSLT